MGLRIANNISAMTTHRWLGVADAGLTKSLERLSSGYRINKAADDAAGLAISESFRADIASFRVAQRNTSEASALLQVAEGGMDQIGNMLTRLKELATQAASGNVGSSERAKIGAEADQLLTEIDRISNSTKYGSSDLLDGTFGVTKTGTMSAGNAATNHLKGIVDSNVVYDIVNTNQTNLTAAGAQITALGDDVSEGTWYLGIYTNGNTVTIYNNAEFSSATLKETATVNSTSFSVNFTNLGVTLSVLSTGNPLSGVGLTYISTDGSGTTLTDTHNAAVTFTRTGLTSLSVNNAASGTYTISDSGDGGIKIYGPTMNEEESFVAAGSTITFDDLNVSFQLGTDFAQTSGELNGVTFTVNSGSGNQATFQIGAQNNADNQISMQIDGVGTTNLAINSIDLTTSSNAQAALDSIDSAISTLAGSRGDIGAYMNRLSYATANLASTIENVQAAESVIRDVDMASEMTEFTKNQILLQAGTAMLAQANMAPQQVLALFG